MGSGAGRAETSCFLCRLFIPAPSAAGRPTRPANPGPRVAGAGCPGSGDGFVAAGTYESKRVLELAEPGQRTDPRADRQTALQRPADRRAARGRGGGSGGEELQPGRRLPSSQRRGARSPPTGAPRPRRPSLRVPLALQSLQSGGAGSSPYLPRPHWTPRPSAADVPLSSLSGGIPGTPTLCTSGKRTHRPVEPALGLWGRRRAPESHLQHLPHSRRAQFALVSLGSAPWVARPRPLPPPPEVGLL